MTGVGRRESRPEPGEVGEVDAPALAGFRVERDRFFREDARSPIPPGSRAGFAGLDYYPPAPELRFTVAPRRGDRTQLLVQTTDGDRRIYRRAGKVQFAVAGEQVELTLLTTDGPERRLFLPFRDATCGTETYESGRYLDVESNDDGTVTIDFNYAYNPYCAYDEAFSCPVPPFENWLDVPIRAGERHRAG